MIISGSVARRPRARRHHNIRNQRRIGHLRQQCLSCDSTFPVSALMAAFVYKKGSGLRFTQETDSMPPWPDVADHDQLRNVHHRRWNTTFNSSSAWVVTFEHADNAGQPFTGTSVPGHFKKYLFHP